MIETRTINTEYGDINILVYVCDYLQETIPVNSPGDEWISVSLLAKINGVVQIYHFCSIQHALAYNSDRATPNQ